MLGRSSIVEQEYRRAVADKVAVNFEIFYQPTETWFEVHAYPSDVGLGIYFQDIDERKRTELARISAEREIDRFFDISIDLLGVVNSIDEFASPTLQAALLAGKPIAISDVIADPLTAAHSDNYRQVGIRAFASIPCLDEEGRWVMTLHLNTSQNARIWRDDEIKLMQTLVTQLWSFVAEARAVLALRAQEQQTRAAQAIQHFPAIWSTQTLLED